jgi:hypothetical protein
MLLNNTAEVLRPHERAGQATPRANALTITTPADAAPRLIAPLPEGVAFTERAAAALRAYLADAGLADYGVFYNHLVDVDMDDLDRHLEKLGEADAAWEPLPGFTAGGVAEVRFEADVPRAHDPGVIHLRQHEVVLARWFWVSPADDWLQDVWLCAAPTPEHYARVRDELRQLRHTPEAAEWRIVSGTSPGERVPRKSQSEPGADDLMLADRVRERVEAEVVRFFGDEAAALYETLRVPYRRGVLMHGPPGNGKTSLIRLIGSRMPHVPGIILRPGARFGTDEMTSVVRRWSNQAPAILVIEDLDSLLKQVEVSAFLNLVDGIDAASGGLLLIATTNHPDKLDPAINNRPGRFDVVMEVPAPDEPLRLAYLRRQLEGDGASGEGATDDALLQQIAADTDGLAFAHLQEIVRLSGLLAINAGRAGRTADDVRAAARRVRDAFDEAVRGFPGTSGVSFGLGHLHKARRSQK